MISIIVAVADGTGAIGQKGNLLCHLPADLQYFKKVTNAHTVIMGKRTWFSLPKHPLPNRRNIVITDIANEKFDGAEAAYSIDEAKNMVKDNEEAFIIGGGMIYRQFMPLADKLYITHLHSEFPNADTFFPDIDPHIWKTISTKSYDADDKNSIPYTFAVYERKVASH